MNERLSFGNWMYKSLSAIKYVPTGCHMERVGFGALFCFVKISYFYLMCLSISPYIYMSVCHGYTVLLEARRRDQRL